MLNYCCTARPGKSGEVVNCESADNARAIESLVTRYERSLSLSYCGGNSLCGRVPRRNPVLWDDTLRVDRRCSDHLDARESEILWSVYLVLFRTEDNHIDPGITQAVSLRWARTLVDPLENHISTVLHLSLAFSGSRADGVE